ncbi:MAG: response regulator transcription factor [Acidobacteriota bacterium]|nr:response regulator transcription factor [Acidobacteriota bacterium]
MSKESHIRLMVVDDHPVVRQGLIAMINIQPDMTVVAEAGDGRQAVELFRQQRPDVTLMDLRLPLMSGVEAITAIRREFPTSRFVVLTTFDGDEDIHHALQAGAQAYLLKDMLLEELLKAIKTVHGGRRYIPTEIGSRLAETVGHPELTSRELEVLELMVKGMNNKDIAAAIRINHGTVRNHVTNILGKLGVHDRTQAVLAAVQRGIVHLK